MTNATAELRAKDPLSARLALSKSQHTANVEFGNRTLKLFDNSKSGPLTAEEIKSIRLTAMPYLLEDGRRSDLALLIVRLIATADDEREQCAKICDSIAHSNRVTRKGEGAELCAAYIRRRSGQ